MTLACDVLVVGGGINGVGIARDAAGRGLSVVLCEKDDLAAHTSSASSKLIHGGLRYLEQYEFGLVRKALREREVLLRCAPHLIRPLRFVMPQSPGQRPAWMIRAGLFLYDHLAKRELLPPSRPAFLTRHPAGAALHARFRHGFEYSDACVDDARLVLANAIDAAERGASILPRTRFNKAIAHDGFWYAELQASDKIHQVRARCLINAAGAWSGQLRHVLTGHGSPASVRLVKGSHIVVKRLFEHDMAYIFQHPDGRIVFAIPYQRSFTLIGTTDVDYAGDPGQVCIDQQELAYLCSLSNHYFRQQVAPDDVVWSYSGLRPLLADAAGNPSCVSRDYRFELDSLPAPVLSVVGGKITTYRKLAEEAMDRLRTLFPRSGPAWTAHASLPGADFYSTWPSNHSVREFDQFVQAMQNQFSWLPAQTVARLAHAYGSRMLRLLHGCTVSSDLGTEVLPGLFEVEIEHWRYNEWALTAEDMLWRRSKLGLHLPAGASAILDDWLTNRSHHSFLG